jgi:hypothetical protein
MENKGPNTERIPHYASRIAVAVLATIGLSYTPLRSAGTSRGATVCEFSAPLSVWCMGVYNVRHIGSYSLLCLVATGCFSKHRLLKAALLTLAISVVVEIEQALLNDGHCRVRDMLPNVLAVSLAALVWLTAHRHRRPQPN